MISPTHLQLLSKYNRWQNESLYAAASTLSDGERKKERGAYFGSIHATLNHILWGDRLWLSRFSDHPAPIADGFDGSKRLYEDWNALREARHKTDEFLDQWTGALTPADIEGDYAWFSGAMGRELSRPRWLIFTHIFNHQTHHRGQVHAMLTAAGAKPDDTDLPFMPGV
ncbi:MAG: DinB family protein [Pseudomonadota bacterium]